MPRKNSKLIHVADDFGISATANRNILKLVQKGKVDRVSVLVDYAPGKLATKDLQTLLSSKIKIDLHLDYRVFLMPNKKRKLREGSYGRLCNFFLGYITGRGRSRQVKEAWENQVTRFIELFGRTPDGINSHQYIHLFPSYFKITLELAEKYKIPYIRYGQKGLLQGRTLVYRILTTLRRLTKKRFEQKNCQSSDYLVSLDWIGNMERFLVSLPEGKTEVVCHPERNEEFRTMMKYF